MLGALAARAHALRQLDLRRRRRRRAARNVGVPVARMKIALFMMTSFAAALLGIITAHAAARRSRPNEGVGREFIFIIAAVVGGCLLTGGYGSAIGAVVRRARSSAWRSIGIVLSQWDTDWFYVFLGVMLLLAVLLNAAIRARAPEARPTMSDAADAHLLEARDVSASTSATSSRSRTSRRTSTPARSRACSATTAPASRRLSRSSPACTSPTRASCSSTASRCTFQLAARRARRAASPPSTRTSRWSR